MKSFFAFLALVLSVVSGTDTTQFEMSFEAKPIAIPKVLDEASFQKAARHGVRDDRSPPPLVLAIGPVPRPLFRGLWHPVTGDTSVGTRARGSVDAGLQGPAARKVHHPLEIVRVPPGCCHTFFIVRFHQPPVHNAATPHLHTRP